MLPSSALAMQAHSALEHKLSSWLRVYLLTRASPVATLAMSAQVRISCHMSSELFDADPSVASATLTPAADSAVTGHTPLASFMLDTGQCTTLALCLAMSAISSADSCVMC